MDYFQTVATFFAANAQPIVATATPTEYLPKRDTVPCRLAHTTAAGVTLRFQDSFFKEDNADRAQELIAGGPYQFTITPCTSLEHISHRSGHNVLPVNWYARCNIDAPSVIEHMEGLRLIRNSTRVEHFFAHDESIVNAWRSLLTDICAKFSNAAITRELKVFQT